MVFNEFVQYFLTLEGPLRCKICVAPSDVTTFEDVLFSCSADRSDVAKDTLEFWDDEFVNWSCFRTRILRSP